MANHCERLAGPSQARMRGENSKWSIAFFSLKALLGGHGCFVSVQLAVRAPRDSWPWRGSCSRSAVAGFIDPEALANTLAQRQGYRALMVGLGKDDCKADFILYCDLI